MSDAGHDPPRDSASTPPPAEPTTDRPRPDSRVSQLTAGDDDADSTTFHDVEDQQDQTPPQSSEGPAEPALDANPVEPAAGTEGRLNPPHVDLPSAPTATAMSSTASLPLSRDPEHLVDPPQATADELVAFLRGQITDLTSQVTSLNGKLVKSYTTRGELEDDLHDIQEVERQLRTRVKDLEADREKWTKEIEAGGWVEKDHVQGEMQRLMTKVVEETKSRETAVQAHSALETEVEALTSNLFSEANKMVAFERLARARAEEKARSVEEAGTSMQTLLQDVQVGLRDTMEKLERRDAEVAELRKRLAAHGEIVPEDPAEAREGENGENGGGEGTNIIFSDGEHLVPSSAAASIRETSSSSGPSQFASPRLLTSALPYHEFLTFITYLRQLRVTTLARPPEPPSTFGHPALSTRGFSSDPPPSHPLSPAQLLAPHLLLSTHLSQPFMKRCVEEDSDPALRLDLAPGLGFLSRRNVANAVVDGTLLIEPLSSGQELPGDKCTLCGCNLEKWLANTPGLMVRSKSGQATSSNGGSSVASTTTNQLNQTMKKMLGGGGWGFSRSNSSNTTATQSSLASSPSTTASTTMAPSNSSQTTTTTNDTSFSFPNYHPSHHPLDHSLQVHQFRVKDTSTQRYPICPSYCLARLRAVCEFWTYVRVIERGLLLEEGFKFVQGRGETIPVSSSTTSLHSTSGTSLSRNGTVNSNGAGAAQHAMEQHDDNPGLGIEARDFEAADTEMEGTPRIVVPEPEDDEASKTQPDDRDEKESDQDKESSAAPGDPEHGVDAGKASSVSASPETSRPQTPTLTLNPNSSSGSLSATRPNRPPRSSARMSPAIGPAPSPPASPSVPNAPPTLPPRRTGPAPPPRHPAHQPTSSSHPAPSSSSTTGATDVIQNATGWEDRCWSEVVRLKESVFWTRVAAVSSDGGSVSARGAKVWMQ
ncbi:hypothetical protein JCM10212_002558 [Sporobolomyces blumeae]